MFLQMGKNKFFQLFLKVTKFKLFVFSIIIVLLYEVWETSRNELKKQSVLTFCYLKNYSKFCEFSAFSFEFQKFSQSKNFFFTSLSEFWKQNTITIT